MKKIIDLKDFKKNGKKLLGKKTILVGGCFDIFHYGHLQFLKQAKKKGDFLVIALESDEFIKKNKKKVPIHNQNQRAEILASMEMVDLVVKLPFFSSDDDYFRLVEIIKPKLIAVSKGDPKIKNKKKQAEKIKAKLKVVVPIIKDFSSSKILKKYETFFSD